VHDLLAWVTQYKDVLGLFTSAVVGALLMKFFPAIWGGIATALRWVGRRFSTRIAARDFEGKYLDWLVTEHQELKLTGIVAAEQAKRPTLEQVFVSLRVGRRDRQRESSDREQAVEHLLESISTLDEALELIELHDDVLSKRTLQELRAGLQESKKKMGDEREALKEWLRAHAARLDDNVLAELELRRVLRRRLVAILGGPGAGKSTLMQYLALTFARERAGDRALRRKHIVRERLGKQEWRLPIFLRLSSVVQHLAGAGGAPVRLADVVVRLLPDDLQAHEAAKTFFHEQLASGRCLVLLDGLDEVPGDEELKKLAGSVRGMIAAYRDTHFLVTSRVAGYRGGISNDFELYYVNDLSEKQISTFIDIWYDAVEKNAVVGTLEKESPAERLARMRRVQTLSSELKQSLSENAGVRQLAVNPMLLSIIALVHRNRAQLPRERSKLYKECSEVLLEQWDIRKGVRVDDTQLKLANKEALMQHVAIALHRGDIGKPGGSREASRDEVVKVMAELLPKIARQPEEAGQLLDRLMERSGILIERQRGVVSFGHHTFQEYYAAAYLAGANDPKEKRYLADEPRVLSTWWREVILLYAGRIPDASEFVERIYAAREAKIFRPRLRLAVQCVHESVSMSNNALRMAILQATLRVRLRGESAQLTVPKPEVVGYLAAWSQTAAWPEHAAVAYMRDFPDDEALIEEQLRQALAGEDDALRNAAVRCLADAPPAVVARVMDVARPHVDKLQFDDVALVARIWAAQAQYAPESEALADLTMLYASDEVVAVALPAVTALAHHYGAWSSFARWRVVDWLADIVETGSVAALDTAGWLAAAWDDAAQHLSYMALAGSVGATMILAHAAPGSLPQFELESLEKLLEKLAKHDREWSTLARTGVPLAAQLTEHIADALAAGAAGDKTTLYLGLLAKTPAPPSPALAARLLESASSSDAAIAAAATNALPLLFGTGHDAAAVARIEHLCARGDAVTRAAACSVAGPLLATHTGIAESFALALGDPSPQVRAAALMALAETPEPTQRAFMRDVRNAQPFSDRVLTTIENRYAAAAAAVHSVRILAAVADDAEVPQIFTEACTSIARSLSPLLQPKAFASVASEPLVRLSRRLPPADALRGAQLLLQTFEPVVDALGIAVLRSIAENGGSSAVAAFTKELMAMQFFTVFFKKNLFIDLLQLGASVTTELAGELIVRLGDADYEVRDHAWRALVVHAPAAAGVRTA
jgi:NACHT domain